MIFAGWWSNDWGGAYTHPAGPQFRRWRQHPETIRNTALMQVNRPCTYTGALLVRCHCWGSKQPHGGASMLLFADGYVHFISKQHQPDHLGGASAVSMAGERSSATIDTGEPDGDHERLCVADGRFCSASLLTGCFETADPGCRGGCFLQWDADHGRFHRVHSGRGNDRTIRRRPPIMDGKYIGASLRRGPMANGTYKVELRAVKDTGEVSAWAPPMPSSMTIRERTSYRQSINNSGSKGKKEDRCELPILIASTFIWANPTREAQSSLSSKR